MILFKESYSREERLGCHGLQFAQVEHVVQPEVSQLLKRQGIGLS